MFLIRNMLPLLKERLLRREILSHRKRLIKNTRDNHKKQLPTSSSSRQLVRCFCNHFYISTHHITGSCSIGARTLATLRTPTLIAPL
jgi:hypothetical protein